MKLVFYSLVLNHHQVCLADEFYNIYGVEFAFVETAENHDTKGGTDDYSKRPYLVKAWESIGEWSKAMIMAETADVCVFGGYEALPFETARLKKNMLSFDMGERMLKRGVLNLLSPRILKMILAYHLNGWCKKPLYKLCMSAFAKTDQNKLLTFKDRCFKWGYFIAVDDRIGIETSKHNNLANGVMQLMWCGRFLKLKHPELPIVVVKRLKDEGYRVQLDIYGDEGNDAKYDAVYPKKKLEDLIKKLEVEDRVTLKGNCPNNEIVQAMQRSYIFLFTSDRQEGWGVVANEAMANGCALVASDEIGSTGFLVKHKETGMIFRSCNVDSLYEQVKYLLDNPNELERISQAGRLQMAEIWNPRNAAKRLLQLIDDIQAGRECSIAEGPCSKA